SICRESDLLYSAFMVPDRRRRCPSRGAALGAWPSHCRTGPCLGRLHGTKPAAFVPVNECAVCSAVKWLPTASRPGYVLDRSKPRSILDREPIFNVPGAVVAVLALLAAVHGGLALLSDVDDEYALWALAFIPAR